MLALSIISIVMVGISFVSLNRSQSETNKATTAVNPKPTITTINALGRLEPRGEVIKISAPSSFGQGSLVAKVLVTQGQKVKAGQLIAILEERDQKEASLNEAKQQVKVAMSRLAQVRAGAKQGEIAFREATINRLRAELQGETQTQKAEITRLKVQLRGETLTQRATVNRLEAELQGQKRILQSTVARSGAQKRNAQTEVKRFENLFQEGAISSQEVENKRLTAETSTQQLLESQATQRKTIATLQEQINEAKAKQETTIATLQQQINEAKAKREKIIVTLQQQINEAKGQLNQTMEVRPTDVANAQAEIDSALATVKRIQTELDSTYIRAPKAGRILKINTKPGETTGNEGIVEMAETDQMYAIAEIYESDIGKIRPGQTATITSLNKTFNGKLQGKVETIGWQVAKKDILDSDPTSDTDARVIEVKIRLEKTASQKVANLTNLQVNVEINTL
ncbi:hemolysin D [Mastigocoleus testarum BC008]|uniref:Hemolysin D n=1 Tax=Mastigocoleus testarum BC008 TaxID=371196 RepID=A0A0V7ZY56_9CYAN|nr:hemolysin D [Mastigocoleus testarum BC008]